MRINILIGLLVVGLAGCGTVTAPSAIPTPAAKPSATLATVSPPPAPSPTGAVAGETAPAPTPSLLQVGEAYLVVWNKYDHVVDQINSRHLRRTVSDYRAWCRETDAAVLEYVDGLESIAFGPDQVNAASYLVARAQKYASRLKQCAGYTSLAKIQKLEPLIEKSGRFQANGETALRKALNLPTGG
jgi:hypothetical protein